MRDHLKFREGVPEGYAPGPWEYNDPEKFTQGHGRFSEVAVYAAGNVFPWRMIEIQGPNEATEIATARLIAAAPDMYETLKMVLEVGLADDDGATQVEAAIYAAIRKATGSNEPATTSPQPAK